MKFQLTVDECTQLGSSSHLKCILQLTDQQIDRLEMTQSNQNSHATSPYNSQSQQVLSDIDVALPNPQQLTSDDTLRFCLSLLWNLTDENPLVCECFIHLMGLQLFQRLLNLFSSYCFPFFYIVGNSFRRKNNNTQRM